MSIETPCNIRSLIRPISPPPKRGSRVIHDELRVDTVKEDHVPVDTPARQKPTPWARTPLDPGLPNIRILRLFQGTDRNSIRCELQVVCLDHNPYYEALSYVWGDSTITESIRVNEVRFEATANLFKFLHSLRHATTDTFLWVDAICIDQSNEEEKSHQIELMTRIYRQANETLVWFGPFDIKTWYREFDSDHKYTSFSKMTPEKWRVYQREGSATLTYLLKQEGFKCLHKDELREFTDRCQNDIFLHTLAMLDEMAKGDHLYTYPVVSLSSHEGSSCHHTLNVSWLLVMDCIRWLITRPWWARVWTLQEASLPRVDPTVHAPPYSFKLSRLIDGVESMWHHNNAICCKWFGQVVTTSNRDDHEYGKAYTQCRAVHGQREVLAEADCEGLGVPLEMVISATQGRKATEIRDHWFGICGFLPERWQEQSKLFSTPSSVAELFSQCSNLLYLESANLTLLDSARRCKQSLVDHLPSWAIDLSNPRTGPEEDGHRWRLFKACGNTTYDHITEWLELRSPQLSVKAIRVSCVQACIEQVLPLFHTPEDVRKLVNEWLILYRKTAHPFDGDAFWRAAFMDRNVQTHWLANKRGPLGPIRLKEIKEWWTAWNKSGDHRDLTFDRKAGGRTRGKFHYKELHMNAEKTKFFVTSQGLPSMGPHDLRPGDEIYALSGCQALVVLRPSEGKEPERLTVVGLCFVDRWMYGRATQGGAVWKAMNIY